MGNKLGDLLRSGAPVLGVTNMYPSAGIIEGMCKGWDFVWIDGQHGELAYDSIIAAIRAATEVGIETMVRVPGMESGLLSMVADMAPSAIMIPMVNNAQDARHIVKSLRFAPLGCRSYGGRRIGDLYGRDYYRDRELLIVTQIETTEGAESAEEIAATEGVDCLFFGATDMKISMGLPLNTSEIENKTLRAAMERTAKAARNAGKHCGCVSYDAATFNAATEMGYRLFGVGVDVVFLRTMSAQKLTEFRGLAAKTATTK